MKMATRLRSLTADDDAAALTPTSAALAEASEARAAKPGEVSTGDLRVRVLQVTDVPSDDARSPSASSSSAAASSSSSWLRYSARSRPATGKPKMDVLPPMLCVVLRVSSSRKTMATESIAVDMSSHAVTWNEEFHLDNVTSNDELKFYCLDRCKSGPPHQLPLRGDDISASLGFIGKVSVPIVRLPEGEEVEQWYPLAPKDAGLPLRSAIRVSLCFVPVGGRSRSRADSIVRPLGGLQSALSIDTRQQGMNGDMSRGMMPVPSSPTAASQVLTVPTGIVDYVIVVGLPLHSGSSSDENTILFRYPVADRPGFPLPTKIEWFCFPGGSEVVKSYNRPSSRVFSFVLVGGDDGVSRCYVVALIMYHQVSSGQSVTDDRSIREWKATSLAFLTRVPLVNAMTDCLLRVASAWLAPKAQRQFTAERHIVDLCHGVVTPIRGVWAVEFALEGGLISFNLPATTTIYMKEVVGRNGASGKHAPRGSHSTSKLSPIKSPMVALGSIQNGLQSPLYSLSTVFHHFGVKTTIELVALALCEYRILIHSSQLSVLCPIAEGLCTLLYPFRWQHPYVPILPRVLSEYLQAPLPYILGVQSHWLPELLESGRPEHLVVADIDRGTLQLYENGPMVPTKLTRGLHTRLQHIFQQSCDGENPLLSASDDCRRVAQVWDDRIERLVRMEFICFMSTMLLGYRECLFFVNQKLPVFNKRRFLSTCVVDNEVIPFLTKLLSTQAFQAFLETHGAPELSVFHSVYHWLSRAKDYSWPYGMPPIPAAKLAPPLAGGSASGAKDGQSSHATTPVYRIDSTSISATIHENSDSPAMATEEVGCIINKLLDEGGDAQLTGVHFDETALETRFSQVMEHPPELRHVADTVGVDLHTLEDHAELLKRPHEVNHMPLSLVLGNSSASNVAMTGARNLSSEEERIEQLLHRCLSSVFTSDDSLSPEDIRACESRFKHQYARELFVLILMQPSQQYADFGITSAGGSTWYNPKGSGSCIGDAGFQLLARLSSVFMDQCSIYEDFTNARGMIQVASHIYRLIEERRGGIPFAKKEYLVNILRMRPICRSLDMWQHACSREIDAAVSADPSASEAGYSGGVSDEIFFSVIGSLTYDMLTVDVPLTKVQTFVAVMCSTYQKDKEMQDTLRQLVENVSRALDLSKDARPSPNKHSAASISPTSGAGEVPSMKQVSPQPARGEYDLDQVIRRKMTINDSHQPEAMQSPNGRSVVASKDTIASNGALGTRKRAYQLPVAAISTLCSTSSPVASISVTHDRVVVGMADASVLAVDLMHPERKIRLDGHTDAIVAVHQHGTTLISGSRDHTLRSWDVRATPRKRHIFGFFSQSDSSPVAADRQSAPEIDSASVSRRSVVMRGHSGPVSCVEVGRHLTTNRLVVASGSADGSVRLWDPCKESSTSVMVSSNRRPLKCLRYLAHFDSLISGSTEDVLEAWDVTTAACQTSFRAHRGAIRDVQVTGERLVTAGSDCNVKVWDARFRSGQSYSHALRNHGGPVLCVSLGGPADPNVCTGSADGVVRVWDLRYVHKGPRLALAGHLGPVTCLQRDFSKLVSASEDGSVRVWDMHSGVCSKDVKAHSSGVTCMALQDSRVVSGSWDGFIRVTDVEVSPIRTQDSG